MNASSLKCGLYGLKTIIITRKKEGTITLMIKRGGKFVSTVCYTIRASLTAFQQHRHLLSEVRILSFQFYHQLNQIVWRVRCCHLLSGLQSKAEWALISPFLTRSEEWLKFFKVSSLKVISFTVTNSMKHAILGKAGIQLLMHTYRSESTLDKNDSSQCPIDTRAKHFVLASFIFLKHSAAFVSNFVIPLNL